MNAQLQSVICDPKSLCCSVTLSFERRAMLSWCNNAVQSCPVAHHQIHGPGDTESCWTIPIWNRFCAWDADSNRQWISGIRIKDEKARIHCLYGLMKMDLTTVYLTLQKLNFISISAGGSVSLQKSSNISAPKRREPVVKHRCIQAVRMNTFDNRHRIKLLCTVWPCKVRR